MSKAHWLANESLTSSNEAGGLDAHKTSFRWYTQCTGRHLGKTVTSTAQSSMRTRSAVDPSKIPMFFHYTKRVTIHVTDTQPFINSVLLHLASLHCSELLPVAAEQIHVRIPVTAAQLSQQTQERGHAPQQYLQTSHHILSEAR